MDDNIFFPLVEVHGTPYERGRQHGEQAARRVRRSADIYARALNEFGFPASRLDQLIGEFRRQIAEFEPAYLDEMQGVADGAGVRFDEVLMINARTEIVTQARLSRRSEERRVGKECRAGGPAERRKGGTRERSLR